MWLLFQQKEVSMICVFVREREREREKRGKFYEKSRSQPSQHWLSLVFILCKIN